MDHNDLSSKGKRKAFTEGKESVSTYYNIINRKKYKEYNLSTNQYIMVKIKKLDPRIFTFILDWCKLENNSIRIEFKKRQYLWWFFTQIFTYNACGDLPSVEKEVIHPFLRRRNNSKTSKDTNILSIPQKERKSIVSTLIMNKKRPKIQNIGIGNRYMVKIYPNFLPYVESILNKNKKNQLIYSKKEDLRAYTNHYECQLDVFILETY